MNHLAHALVAERTGTSVVGNLMGDFVKGDLASRYHGDLLRGILLHRQVDAFTDDHPAFLRCRGRFRPPFRRFAGVLVDVFWDHLLARDWERHGGGEPLAGFASRVYAALAERRAELPARMLGFVEYMTDTNLLVAYAVPEGVARALAGLSRRFPRENPLAEGLSELHRIGPEVEADLAEFLPDLWQRVGAG